MRADKQIINSNGAKKKSAVPSAVARSNQLLQEIQAFADIFGEYFGSKEGPESAVRINSRDWGTPFVPLGLL